MVERNQMYQSSFNDMPIHKFIPMEKFDLIQPNQVRILYYQNPSRFYVYLPQKINIHAQFQIELQRAMQNYQSVSSSVQYQRFQPVVAQDNHAIWHRATILDFNSDSTEINVYFIDFGQEEKISITNIRPLPTEFIRQPAFAIPCRLYGIYPLHGTEQSTWKLDDPVHDEFNRLMANSANCKVCDIKEHICYDVEIDIPNVGDLGTFLFEQNLVSRMNMRPTQPPQRIPPGFSDIPQASTTRLLQKPIVQQSPSSSLSTDSSSEISTLSPQDGYYIITHVYSAIEFYGHSQVRSKELDALHKHLEMIYNNNTNDQSLSVNFLMEGVSCVIQQGEKYHRVVMKHRESESRVLVKLVDRGDEILVDTSELLQLEKKYFTIPAFAQPFRLHNYDESHSTANITRKLKRLILNQRVHITQHLPIIHGFYPVEVKLSDNQSLNQILLSNDINPIIPAPVEIQRIKSPQINEDLPAPQKLLTAPATNRFTSNEQTSRFSRSTQQEELNSPVNGHQTLMPEQNRRGFSTERNGNSNRGGRNNDENDGQRTGGFNTRGGGGFGDRGNRNGFGDRNNDENDGQSTGRFSNRGGGGGFGDRGNRSGFGDRNNDENDGQRTGGFNNRGGGGFGDRGNRNGFGERNYENRNENNGQRTGGFNNRGARNGDFQDRNNRYRNNQDDDNNENNNAQRFANRGGFNGERRGRSGGNFQSHRDRGDDREDGGDNGRRGGFGDRGGSRGGRGGFADRGNRGGGRGGRSGGFNDRNENGFRSNSDNNDAIKTFSGWPNIKSTTNRFEAGDHFNENEIPKEAFQFVISHIEKSNDFFIQLCSKEKELSELSETLQEEYKDAPELNLNSIKINQACLAKSSDNCWYRAIILSTNSTKTKIRFIDFGDTMNVENKTIRQLANKFCLTSPYAYHCTLKNLEDNENFNTNEIIGKCANQKFDGKIEKKFSDDKYLLQSDNFEKLINGIKTKSQTNNIPCFIVYIDNDKHQFYIQNDHETMKKINDEITMDNELSSEEININSMVISTFSDAPYRAIIQSDLDENVSVYFVDYGNTDICSKISLKKCNEQLKTYPYQAKRCQLYDISLNNLDQAFEKLDEYIESDKTEISIINQNDDLLNVILYIDGECFNEKFSNETSIDIDDQSSTTTTTTVKEQERPISATGKRNNEEILSPVGNSLSTSMNIKRQKSESETEVNSIKYYKGILTHIDKNKAIVYLQLLPESESNLERINALIDTIIQEDKRNLSYEIGDYIIAQFTEDDNYYRARIESYSSSNELYTVYFLDYGNIDENVPKDHLYSYSNELKEIEPQAHGYSVENLTSIRSLIEEKINDTIEFDFLDEINSIIHFKFDNENQISNQPKTFTANISGTNKDCFYIHILPDSNTLICEMDELLQSHPKEHNPSNLWNINDLCIVFDSEQNQYFRGKILSIDNEQYDIQCIDYGNILINIKNDNLYLLTNNDLIKQNPLARQCRLYGVNDKDQFKAIEEIISHINPTERVTITVENDQNDQCMFVMLFRDNNEIVNDQYIKQEIDINTKNAMSTNSSDSAIDTSNDHQITSPIGIPQAESTHQYGDTTDLTISTVNQTIDFGENDPSTSDRTIKDETEN